MSTSVREYAVLYLGGKNTSGGAAASGGNVMLGAGQHALDGPEHTGQLPADRVSVEDTGGLYVATDAEGALAEVAQEVVDHLDDMVDAHDASAISIADVGLYFTGTDVEAALQELAAGVSAVIALDDLTDVTITSPTIADRLRFDGSVWRNSALRWEPLFDYLGSAVLAGTLDPVMVEMT